MSTSTPATPAPDPIPARRALDVARAVRTVDGVTDLHSGRFGEVALLYPRRRVPGLRVSPPPASRLEIHVVIDLSRRRPLAELSGAVREAAAGTGLRLPVDVVIADAVGVAGPSPGTGAAG